MRLQLNQDSLRIPYRKFKRNELKVKAPAGEIFMQRHMSSDKKDLYNVQVLKWRKNLMKNIITDGSDRKSSNLRETLSVINQRVNNKVIHQS